MRQQQSEKTSLLFPTLPISQWVACAKYFCFSSLNWKPAAVNITNFINIPLWDMLMKISCGKIVVTLCYVPNWNLKRLWFSVVTGEGFFTSLLLFWALLRSWILSRRVVPLCCWHYNLLGLFLVIFYLFFTNHAMSVPQKSLRQLYLRTCDGFWLWMMLV